MRTRMSWDWVGEYPVFVYTTFLDNFKFNVKIMIGEKGNQNADCARPWDKPDIEYVQNNIASKNGVVNIAFEKARIHLNLSVSGEEMWDGVVLECCTFCGAQAETFDKIKHYESCDPTAVYEYN